MTANSQRIVSARTETVRLKYVAEVNPTAGRLNGQPDEIEVSFVPMESVSENGGLDASETRALEDVKSGYTYFEEGDVLIAKITPCFENGKGAIARKLKNNIGFGTTELHILRPTPRIDRRFLFYLTISRPFRHQGTGAMYGAGGQKRVPTEFVENYRVPLPPIETQRAIAEFLDERTGKIDALIEKKRRLIELLKEKRQAVITRAVTRGLNPDAPMKPSGVEWLGNIPEHWEVKRLRHIACDLGVGLVINPSSYVDEQGKVPFFYGSDITEYRLHPETARRMTEESSRSLSGSRLWAGDIVTVRVGEPGVSAVVPAELDGANCASVMIVRQSRHFDSDWLAYALNSDWGKYQVARVAYGAAQKQFNIGHAVDFLYPVPPVHEQKAIVRALDREREQHDKLRTGLLDFVCLLKELRTATISAAITGEAMSMSKEA